MKVIVRKIGPGILFACALSAMCPAQQDAVASEISPAGQRVERHAFFSKALQRSMPYQVILPGGYEGSVERYPVLYLLHGWQGDENNYLRLTDIVKVVAAYPIIVVMPRGDNSWYVNSSAVAADRYGDYLFHDVIEEADKQFRTVASPEGRAIAGLSMGGYGATLLSLQHPGFFRFVGSLSGAFAGPSGIERVLPALKPSTDAAFGPADSAARKEDSVDRLLSSDDPKSQPYLYLACGTNDPLLPSNRHVVEELSNGKFAYEYHELPGAHTWAFWNSQLGPMLAAMGRVMHLGPVEAVTRSSISQAVSAK